MTSPLLTEPQAVPRTTGSVPVVSTDFMPHAPQSLEEAGLSATFIEQLLLKMLYFRGESVGRELSDAMGLAFSLLEGVVEQAKRNRLIEAKRSSGFGSSSTVFALAEAGRALVKGYVEASSYAGRAPVPMEQYVAGVRAQRLQAGWLTPAMLEEAFQHMVISPKVLSEVGPAVNSNKSFLIYGQPGNGKTYLAEALLNLRTKPIYVPYAVEYQGSIIQIYDPIYHKVSEDAGVSILKTDPFDRRWFSCPRPFITCGGELTLDMLDLSFNAAAKVYDAPLQMKANNGTLLVDDFGRQRVSPAEVLNRWIIPMERRIDYLNLQTGGKLTVPFESFLVFSTNLRPEQLGDEAFLRRIQYKMLVKSPDVNEFTQIFANLCLDKELSCDSKAYNGFLQRHYRATGKKMRRCHPRDLISHALDYIQFEGLPYELTDSLLDRAFESCFTDSNIEMD